MANNFKKLEEELIESYGEPPKDVKEGIDSTMGIFSVLGSVLDLFVTKLIQTLVSVFGGEYDKKE